MTPSIIGTGWATPLGRDIPTICDAFLSGQLPQAPAPELEGVWPVLRVPAATLTDATSLPRLRRSSAISHQAVAAARDAVRQAGLDAAQLARTALLFATSDGGVVYTRRFYNDIVERGIGAGSPLLFPETVYNAPASHVAAALGLNEELLTLVGDASVGLEALQTAAELMEGTDLEHCLVVAAQEADWVSAEAYGRWQLIRQNPDDPSIACFAEGAAAVVLAREGSGSQLACTRSGLPFSSNADGARRLTSLLRDAPIAPELIISSRVGNRFDLVEAQACSEVFPTVQTLLPRHHLGEALAASTLEAVILADHFLRNQSFRRILVTAAGYNCQLGALFLTEPPN